MDSFRYDSTSHKNLSRLEFKTVSAQHEEEARQQIEEEPLQAAGQPNRCGKLHIDHAPYLLSSILLFCFRFFVLSTSSDDWARQYVTAAFTRWSAAQTAWQTSALSASCRNNVVSVQAIQPESDITDLLAFLLRHVRPALVPERFPMPGRVTQDTGAQIFFSFYVRSQSLQVSRPTTGADCFCFCDCRGGFVAEDNHYRFRERNLPANFRLAQAMPCHVGGLDAAEAREYQLRRAL